jgi:hypothetical protein
MVVLPLLNWVVYRRQRRMYLQSKGELRRVLVDQDDRVVPFQSGPAGPVLGTDRAATPPINAPFFSWLIK